MTYSHSPDLFIRGFVQWNSRREVVGGSFLLNYQYLPGSDLFLVYNHAWDTEGGWRQLNRSVQMKLAYYWQLVESARGGLLNELGEYLRACLRVLQAGGPRRRR
ncbi:hypothetical protein ACFL6X_07625 [Candidatus Latescibacterota bacterium]